MSGKRNIIILCSSSLSLVLCLLPLRAIGGGCAGGCFIVLVIHLILSLLELFPLSRAYPGRLVLRAMDVALKALPAKNDVHANIIAEMVTQGVRHGGPLCGVGR